VKQITRVLLTLSLLLFIPSIGTAYVAGSSSVPEGGWEVTTKLELMRGLAGPENLPETRQRQRPEVNIYEVAGGYNFGSLSVFQDIKLKLGGTFYTSASELLSGVEIYPRDEGWILGAEVSSVLFHERDKVFAIFLRSQTPFGMNVEKFVNPKVDRFGLGFQTGFKFNDDFGQETVVYLGSGISDAGFKQNPSFSASLLGVWILTGDLFPHGAALRIGPFYDGDLAERDDARYATQGVRAFRLGFTVAATYSFTKGLSLDAYYIQKFTGTYFRATKDFIFALRTVF